MESKHKNTYNDNNDISYKITRVGFNKKNGRGQFSMLPRVLPTSKWQSKGEFTNDDQWVTNQKQPHKIGTK